MNNIWVCLPQEKGRRCLVEEFSPLQNMEDLPKKSPSNEKATLALSQLARQYSSYSSPLKILVLNNAHPSSLDIFPFFAKTASITKGQVLCIHCASLQARYRMNKGAECIGIL